MKIFVALLRGINVSGQKKIKMADLKLQLENLNLKEVRTYIQSGNIIFKSEETNTTDLANKINSEILKQYGFNVPTLVLTSDYIKKVIENNPWKKNKNTIHMYFTLLEEEPFDENIKKIESEKYLPDEFNIFGKVIYVYAANGYGRTKLNNNFFEKKLKVQATTRNWKTINQILELINE